MLTVQQYLLMKLAEECTELAKDALKAAQHGMDNFHPAYPDGTNKDRINHELHDVLGIAEMLGFWGTDREKIEARKDKTIKYIKKVTNQSPFDGDGGIFDDESL